jgi:hypothetical protein
MKRLMITLAGSAIWVGGFAVLPAPALAQAGQVQLDVFGNDPCPATYICVRHKESDRYRMPEALNPKGTRQQRQSWSRQSQALRTVGATGIGSCSAVGPGGFTGCLNQEIKQTRRESREATQQDQAPE